MRSLEILQPCDFTMRDGTPTGAPGVMRCRGCGHTVTDLAALSEAEALAFLARRAPRDCVRFSVTADRRVIFADGVGALMARISARARPMISVASLALSACAGQLPPAENASAAEEGLPLLVALPAADRASADPEVAETIPGTSPLSPSSSSSPPSTAPLAPALRPSPRSAITPAMELSGFEFNDEPIVPPPTVERPGPR
jgi:hypothetical protein